MGEVRIVPVESKTELDRFIRLPARLNRGDPNWVTPLDMERRTALSPKSNPFFDHAEVQFWLAVKDGRDVGRISAQIDALAPELPDRPAAGHFGMLAAEDDAAVFAALFAAAEGWLKARGKAVALGPFNLSINEEVGLLVDGFTAPPFVMMGHDPAYAGRRVEAQGYAKAKDIHAYICDLTADLPPAIVRRVREKPPAGVTLRMLDMKRYDEEVRAFVAILNDAWAGNWGFTPVTEAETAALGESLKAILDPRLVWFVEVDGDVAGFTVGLPNLNEAIRDLDGRLLPFGWAKLLWRLKVSGLKSCRIPLAGVKRRYFETMAGRMMPFMTMDRVRTEALKLGFQTFEMSWILEENRPMRHIAEVMGARVYKTYRIYEKALA
ncbi:MAG: dATP pyrophosphohydrolase [Caulobacteraceae bacterium]|nr:dATP pyrophosphohydrolase [Caulobacteraceae bacterium]